MHEEYQKNSGIARAEQAGWAKTPMTRPGSRSGLQTGRIPLSVIAVRGLASLPLVAVAGASGRRFSCQAVSGSAPAGDSTSPSSGAALTGCNRIPRPPRSTEEGNTMDRPTSGTDRRAEVMAKLTSGIKALTQSERWSAWHYELLHPQHSATAARTWSGYRMGSE